MPHTYRAVIKGNTTQAVHAAQQRGFTVLGIVRNGDAKEPAILTIERNQNGFGAITQWFTEGPSQPPFPDGTLLFYSDEVTGEERKRVWIARPGWPVDDDLSGLGSDPHKTPLVEYDLGDAVITIWDGGRYYAFRGEVTVLDKGKPVVVLSEAIGGSTKEDAARHMVLRAISEGYLYSIHFDRFQEVLREKRAGITSKRPGWKMDSDLDGLGLEEIKPWSVSTLVPALHGRPRYKYFDDLASALDYARSRVRSGKRLREGGKAYFVLGHAADTPASTYVYRVFRAFKRAEQRPGHAHYIDKPEFVIVQKPTGTNLDGTTRWKVDWAHSIEILDSETEKVRKRPYRRN